MNTSATNLGKTVPMKAESVNFTDGMIVTANDLSTSMGYPIALMQSVNKAVFGCGVVCGFELKPDPELCDKTKPCDPCDDTSEPAYPSFTVQIGHGTALDCSGLPVELCTPEPFDLGSKQCGCDVTEGEVCIFIRRVSSREAPRSDCCGSATTSIQCMRRQDHVEIRAFPKKKGPEHACMLPFDTPVGNEYGCEGSGGRKQKEKRWPQPDEICECLTNCRDSDCCGEGWILLGCLEICEAGIVKSSFESACEYRKWIKTIECSCRRVEASSVVEQGEEIPIMQQLQNKTPDPDIEKKMMEIVKNEERVAIFKFAGIINMEHFGLVLEKQGPLLQQVFGFKTPDKLEEWNTATQQIPKGQKKSDSPKQFSP